jgi:hypothetical protein
MSDMSLRLRPKLRLAFVCLKGSNFELLRSLVAALSGCIWSSQRHPGAADQSIVVLIYVNPWMEQTILMGDAVSEPE